MHLVPYLWDAELGWFSLGADDSTTRPFGRDSYSAHRFDEDRHDHATEQTCYGAASQSRWDETLGFELLGWHSHPGLIVKVEPKLSRYFALLPPGPDQND